MEPLLCRGPILPSSQERGGQKPPESPRRGLDAGDDGGNNRGDAGDADRRHSQGDDGEAKAVQNDSAAAALVGQWVC